MGRLEEIEKRDRFVTLTTHVYKDSFTSDDRDWLIARVREAASLSKQAAQLLHTASTTTPVGCMLDGKKAWKCQEALRDFLAKLEASDA